MATSRYYSCVKHKKVGDARSLFDALYSHATGKLFPCPACGQKTDLHLKFPFGLGASDSEFHVLGCFLPSVPEQWEDVTFYPFLVILKRVGRDNAVWLPYWHVVNPVNGKKKTKYGQWAPCMDEKLFSDLLRQAQASGFLVNFAG